MATITQLGSITTQTNWRGSISAQKMLDDGFVSLATLNDAASKVDDFFCPEDQGAEARCIDGRCNSGLPESHLGAQVPGGTPGAALAYRLGVIIDDFSTGSFLDDAHVMLEKSLALGFVPGDHRDTHGHGVGCGAIDKMDQALQAMVAPELVADNERLTRAVLGAGFDENIYMHVMGAALILAGRADEYLYGREKSIDEVEEKLHHQVSVLEGDHHECLMVLNVVPGTTFATKRFSDTYTGMQAFNYDVWRSFELAEKLFPSIHDQVKKQQFVHARIATAVATLMVLTDGTQRLVVRSS